MRSKYSFNRYLYAMFSLLVKLYLYVFFIVRIFILTAKGMCLKRRRRPKNEDRRPKTQWSKTKIQWSKTKTHRSKTKTHRPKAFFLQGKT